MRKTLKKAVVLGAILSSLYSVTSFADVLKNLTVNFTEGKTDQGVIWSAEPSVSRNAEIVNWDVSSDYSQWKAGKKVTFTIEVEGTDNWLLSKSKTDVRVSGTNADLVSKSVSDGHMTLKVNYFPTMQLENPKNIYFEDQFIAVWDEVDEADEYEVRIYEDGSKSKTVSVTKPEIDLSDYATDGSEVTFEVRAVPKNEKQSKYLKASDWVSSNDSTTADYNNTAYGKFSGSDQNMTFNDTEGNQVSGWQQINGNWYYFNPNNGNKAIVDRWEKIGEQWFLFNKYGIMQSGWVLSNGYWYFLNTSHDGTFGKMLTGWIQTGPASPKYYLNQGENQHMPYGAMYANTTTPDGHHVDESGACYDKF